MYLITNFFVREPSTSSLCINSCTEISYATYRFGTITTQDGPDPSYYATDYWHRIPADGSRNVQLRKKKELEVE